jgi:hypothetical protein
MFDYDVFFSYSSKDKSIVHALAERLKNDGRRVWLDNWVIEPGESIPLKIHQGLESSHTVLVCMSPAYFGSDWGWAEHLTQLFEDPTNKQRRLIPLLIEDCTRPKIIAHLSYIVGGSPAMQHMIRSLPLATKRALLFLRPVSIQVYN